MRKFHSYGPVNARNHFLAPRTVLVDQSLNSLIGSNNEDGHYFTLWSPRQTGKKSCFVVIIAALGCGAPRIASKIHTVRSIKQDRYRLKLNH